MSEPAPPPGGSNLPARRLSNAELEAVIRRAVELQAAGGGEDEGIAEAEVVRIGKELGLEPHLVRRTIADVRSRPVEEHGVMAGLMGPGVLRAARTIRRPAAALGMFLEQYLLQVEHMVVQRRYPDRTRYVRATGMAAGLARATSRIGQRHAPVDLALLDVGVTVVDDDTSVVELSTDLSGPRAGFAAGGATLGLGGGGAVALVAVASTAPPLLALLGLPVLAAGWFGLRAGYGAMARGAQERLESFLDRLEHGELQLPRGKPEWRRQLGI
ncbi:MAG TPA: hypothetical protein VFX98_18685 [Longimicrobiaceae bacterium]|nr:hypothetical protein [Longimicrobiaceae bacterium]